MTSTIETRLSTARRLLSLAEVEHEEGRNERAASSIEDVCAQLLVLAKEMRAEAEPADDVFVHCCGHCGHLCDVSELRAGACPRCGTLKEGVLVITDRFKRERERENAPLIRPQGHAATVEDNNGVRWTI